MSTTSTDRKRTAALIVNNEIIQNAMKEILEEEGFGICQSIESCADTSVGFIGSYFALLGILRHVRSVNPALPLVLIQNDNFLLDRDFEPYNDFYDVILLKNNDEMAIKEKFLQWFSKGSGKFLLNW